MLKTIKTRFKTDSMMLKVEWNAKEIKGNTLNACIIFYSHGEKKRKTVDIQDSSEQRGAGGRYLENDFFGNSKGISILVFCFTRESVEHMDWNSNKCE